MKTGGFSFVEKEKTEERERPGRKKEGEKEKEKREKGKKERRKEGKKLCWQKGRGLRVKKSCREGEFEVRALFQRGELLGKKNFLKMRSRGRFWERRRLDERRMRERKN